MLWPAAKSCSTSRMQGSAAVKFACVQMSNSKQEPHMRKVTIEHVHVETGKPFAEVAAALETRLGRFDLAVYEQLRSGANPAAVMTGLEGMVGPSGYMLFGTNDHGALLRLADQKRKAVQYIVGNPLFALRMTQHDIRAALYAPLRLLLYEDEQGRPAWSTTGRPRCSGSSGTRT